jgi:hypothetical protein
MKIIQKNLRGQKMPMPELSRTRDAARCPNDQSFLVERLLREDENSQSILRTCLQPDCEFSEIIHFERPLSDPIGYLKDQFLGGDSNYAG